MGDGGINIFYMQIKQHFLHCARVATQYKKSLGAACDGANNRLGKSKLLFGSDGERRAPHCDEITFREKSIGESNLSRIVIGSIRFCGSDI
jgi:hypothetical protein